MAPRKKVTPQMRMAWTTYQRTFTQQRNSILKLRDDARYYRAQYDQLITELNVALKAMILAQTVFTEALGEQYPVDVLPKGEETGD